MVIESTLWPFEIGNVMITMDKPGDVWLSNKPLPSSRTGQGLSQPLLVGAQLARGYSLPSTGESNSGDFGFHRCSIGFVPMNELQFEGMY